MNCEVIVYYCLLLWSLASILDSVYCYSFVICLLLYLCAQFNFDLELCLVCCIWVPPCYSDSTIWPEMDSADVQGLLGNCPVAEYIVDCRTAVANRESTSVALPDAFYRGLSAEIKCTHHLRNQGLDQAGHMHQLSNQRASAWKSNICCPVTNYYEEGCLFWPMLFLCRYEHNCHATTFFKILEIKWKFDIGL